MKKKVFGALLALAMMALGALGAAQEGVVVRTAVKGISKQGRATQGVHVMKVADKDRVTAVAITRTKAQKVGKASEAQTEEDVDAEE